MLLSSTSTLENKTIVKYHGLVNGESLIGSNIYKDLFQQEMKHSKLWKTRQRNLVPTES